MAEGKSWVKWVVIGCSGLLVLGVVVGAGIFFGVRKATAGPEQIAKDFLAAAAAGEIDRAHDYFSAPLKEAQPLADFRRAVEENPSLFAVVDTSFTERSVDMAGAKLAGTATLKAGTQVPVSFGFARENGAWKLIAYHIGTGE